MKNKNRIYIYPLMITGVLLMFLTACKKDETTPSSSKKDPVITWANPADIMYGKLLSTTQLNATVDASGTFLYTPPTGTKLNEGANQDLKVDFTPTDAVTYNSVSKTVKINVMAGPGSGIIFNPNLTYGTVTDIDGNVYKTITIGTQTWMAENLRTTRYRNGDSMPNETNVTEWGSISSGAYCNYNNTSNSDTIATYGRLYNWYSVNESRKIAPAGWHIPSYDEWTTLTNSLGGQSVAGCKLIETGTTHWHSPNMGATNESGFTALPGGSRVYTGHYFHWIGKYCAFWSSIEGDSGYTLNAFAYHTTYDSPWVSLDIYDKSEGISIRCIKD
ncbi:MAG: FISUMP domain-containing protein [Bacteroidales bacterium]